MTNCPLGHVVSGNGWHATIDELGYFGELVLGEGNWHGRQLVSAEYVREATRPHRYECVYKAARRQGLNPNCLNMGMDISSGEHRSQIRLCSGNYGQAIMVSFDKDAVFSYQAMAGFEPTARKLRRLHTGARKL